MKKWVIFTLILCTLFGVKSQAQLRTARDLELSQTIISYRTWSYDKNTVIEFFKSWFEQNKFDAYLDETERDLQQQFIERMIFQVDRKYTEQIHFRTFLIQTLNEMIEVDENPQNQTVTGNQALFLHRLSDCLKDVLEPSENILAFIRSYVDYSSLREPKNIDDFVQLRSYVNSTQIEAAEQTTIEESLQKAADAIQKNLEQQNTEQATQQQINQSNSSSLESQPQP